MSYFPFDIVDETTFPKGVGKDLNFNIRVLKEKWNRFYPLLPFHSLVLDYEKVAAGIDGGISLGEGVSTSVDDLWGEDLPDFDQTVMDYSNPHSQEDSPEPNAIEGKQYRDPVNTRIHILEEATEYQLKKMGRDLMNDLIATFLTPMLDDNGLVVKSGDEFTWNGERYKILDVKHRGFWKMTNLFLFVECNCEKARYGT